MTKKPRKQSSKKSGGSAEPQTSAEAGHNQLNDDELQALFFQHKKLYEAKKGQAVKAQGFKKPDDGEAGDGERLPRKEWQQQLREQNEQAERDIAAATRSKDVGTKPATHQVVE